MFSSHADRAPDKKSWLPLTKEAFAVTKEGITWVSLC